MIPFILSVAVGWLMLTPLALAGEAFPGSPFGDRAILRPGQVVQGDYFAVGPHVEISGIVNGDLYAAGGDVLVDGTVNGDVIVAGAKVMISGIVAQDARIAGGQVTITGTIGRNLTVGGGDIQLTGTAKVQENLLAGGGNVQLAGHIGRDARVGAGNATLSGGVERDLAVASGSVHLMPKAVVGGKLRYWSETAPVIDEEAIVQGAILRRPLPEGWSLENARRGMLGMRVMTAVISFLSTLILGLVLLRLYPIFTLRVMAAMRERPGPSLGWGTLALLATPIVAVSFLVTLLALPIGVILLALYLAMVYLARIYAITCLGQLLFRRPPDSLSLTGPFLAGLVLYSILSFIPVIGGFVTILTILFGLGALLIGKRELVVVLREQGQV